MKCAKNLNQANNHDLTLDIYQRGGGAHGHIQCEREKLMLLTGAHKTPVILPYLKDGSSHFIHLNV